TALPSSVTNQQEQQQQQQQQQQQEEEEQQEEEQTTSTQPHSQVTPPLLDSTHFPLWASAFPDDFPDRPKVISAISEARRAKAGLARLHPTHRTLLLEAERIYNVDEWNLQFNIPAPMREALDYVKTSV
ncbi:hypothetical protein AURDEDRAFT_177800, partial [Auricularia subglabra TFB-10046 SS5]